MRDTLTRIAPWVALGAVGGLAFGLAGAALAGCLLALSEVLQFLRDHAAMRSAHEMWLARVSNDSAALAARVESIEKQLKEALTPERMELARGMLKRQMANALGKGL